MPAGAAAVHRPCVRVSDGDLSDNVDGDTAALRDYPSRTRFEDDPTQPGAGPIRFRFRGLSGEAGG